MTLIQNVKILSPDYSRESDILISFDKIYKIMPPGEFKAFDVVKKIIACDGLFAFAGLIDQHAHITGGGGEQGFESRIGPINPCEIVKAGVTTIVGLLGADGYTKSLKDLYAKAKALDNQGLSAYIYSGSYAVEPVTLTGSITGDLILIDKVIGLGEIAISDHRSSHAGIDTLIKLASDTHLGALISNKAGVVHFHIGDGKRGLSPLYEILENSDLPAKMFVPTHLNRSEKLLSQGAQYCKNGGFIDLTAGESEGVCVEKAIKMLISEGVDLSRVTISSDANGSGANGALKIQNLYDDLIRCVKSVNINPGLLLSLASRNAARVLKLYPQKGIIAAGSDADIVIANKDFNIKMLFSKGRLLLEND